MSLILQHYELSSRHIIYDFVQHNNIVIYKSNLTVTLIFVMTDHMNMDVCKGQSESYVFLDGPSWYFD